MWSGIQLGILIFSLRIVDISLYTLRLLTIRRGRKALAFTFAFFQSVFFVTAIRAILANLDKPIVVLGYAAGFATGLVVGMLLEARLAIGYTHLRIISTGRGLEITERLRGDGFAVTEVACRGRDGNATLLNCHILRKDTGLVVKLVGSIDEDAFITAENVVSVRHGFWHRQNPALMH
jgi:uncharacterized protein YebE (UPF0316 family)